MSRRQLDPLRPLTAEERGWLARISLSHSEPAAHVARATMLLAVAAGQSYTVAAHAAGRRSGDAVAHLVSRFNHDGVAAVECRASWLATDGIDYDPGDAAHPAGAGQ